MPRKVVAQTPEEIIIGYFVTKPLDRVQETLSHVQTIVKSRTFVPRASLPGQSVTAETAQPRAPRPSRAKVRATMPPAAPGVNHATTASVGGGPDTLG